MFLKVILYFHVFKFLFKMPSFFFFFSKTSSEAVLREARNLELPATESITIASRLFHDQAFLVK